MILATLSIGWQWLLIAVAVLVIVVIADRVGNRLISDDPYYSNLDDELDELYGRHPRPARLPATEALNEVGDGADAVVFDFPWEDPRPALRVIKGGHDTGGWAA